jgi:hypothetical protein
LLTTIFQQLVILNGGVELPIATNGFKFGLAAYITVLDLGSTEDCPASNPSSADLRNHLIFFF